jgi:membrane peptidoglycan carboxypeptidase
MADQGFITQDEAEAAKEKEISFSNNQYGNITAPHFVMYVKEKLVEKYGEQKVNEGGLKVFTTLDLEKQNKSRKSREGNDRFELARNNNSNAYASQWIQIQDMIMQWCASKDFFDSNIDGNDNVSLKGRQPGSSFQTIRICDTFM